MLVLFFCLLSLTAAAAEVGLDGKVFLFPYKTDSSYVKLTPKKPMSLTAFTLCMRVATEFQGERTYMLFTYRTPHSDEITVWVLQDGRLSLFLKSSYTPSFRLPPLSSIHTHLCVTWESATGRTAFWMNGERSMNKFDAKGQSVRPGGTVLLGQYPTKYLGGFYEDHSFVGEITDLHMWDYVLSGTQIKEMYSYNGLNVPVGNIFDWNTINYHIEGNVQVVKNESF